MNEFELLVDLHRDAERQGPGGNKQTQQALDLAGIDRERPLKVADIGCGTGASALVLANNLLNADITAIDFLQSFLDELEIRAQDQDVASCITTLCTSMEQLSFENESLDVIWSEGAIYNIGFEQGVTDWRRFLKPDGLLVVSEISWLTSEWPVDIENHWYSQYPEIDTVSAKIAILEKHGYTPMGHFLLPEHCWLDNYYYPMCSRFKSFLDKHQNSHQAQSIVDAELAEIELYKKYKAYYGYGVYVAKKMG